MNTEPDGHELGAGASRAAGTPPPPPPPPASPNRAQPYPGPTAPRFAPPSAPPFAPPPAPPPAPQAPPGPPAARYAQQPGYRVGTPPPPPPPPKKNRTGLVAGGAALAVIAAGGIAFAATRGGGDSIESSDSSARPTTTVAADAATPPATAAPAATTAPGTATAAPPASMDSIARSVVQILGYDVAGNPVCVGSGTIISAEGLILTNAHVVENGGECAYDRLVVAITADVNVPPTPMYGADVVGFDAAFDLAAIQVRTDFAGAPVTVADLPALPLGDSDQVGLGDTLRILGYPTIGGETITFTEGSVAGFTAESGVANRAWIKTDATIAGGNSGGTAVNDTGQLVGIPTQASAGDAAVADCRVVEDTNGDNVIDDSDSCIPIGGFINGLRPINLASGVIEQGRLGQVVAATSGPVATVDVGSVFISAPRFASDVVDDTPVDDILSLPTGAPKVCGFFDYEGMADGVLWDAVWTVDGELNEEFSVIGSEWVGGATGTAWWVCALGAESGLPDGEYELTIYVQDEAIAANTVYVGDSYVPVDVTFLNATGGEICYLRLSSQQASSWGPDRLGLDTIVADGATTTLTVIGNVYDILAETCEDTVLVEVYGIDLTAGGEYTLRP